MAPDAKPEPDQPHSASPSRRNLVRGLAGLVCAPFVIIPGRALAGTRLVVVNFGGAMGAAKQTAIYDPFSSETGIEVVAVPGSSLARIKLQARSGHVEWDVVDLLPTWLPTATRLGLLEPIDDSVVRRTGCMPQAYDAHAVSGGISAGGIAFTTRSPRIRDPQTWPEFWNVADWPGRRGLRRRITDTLEIALMADGVPAAEVYPCDIERAFRALDRIRPDVNHWIAQTEQTVSLIQQDETDFTYSFSTRVKDMQEAGAPIGYSFKQNILSVSWTAIVKGARNRDAAMRLCAFIANRDVQVTLSNLTGDAPAYATECDRVTPAIRQWLPDLEDPDNLFSDAQWWDSRLEALTVRFQDWLFS